MKTYVLYHGNCPDGFGAAFAAWLRFGDAAEYIPVSYGKPIPDMLTGDETEVFIVDFSYSTRELRNLITSHGKVVVLDHHHTAKLELESMAEEYNADPYLVRFDMNKSGAVLAWEYFHQLEVPEFFQYLQDRDLWTFKLPFSREVSAALGSYPFDFKEWSDLSGIVQFGQIYELPGIRIDELKKEGAACLRLKNQQVQNMVKHHRRATLDGKHKAVKFNPPADQSANEANGFGTSTQFPDLWFCPVSNASVFFSEVGEALLNLYPDAPFAAYYSDRADGKRQWGLRSRPEFDCSVIAKAFGGGGHKQAAGFVQDL